MHLSGHNQRVTYVALDGACRKSFFAIASVATMRGGFGDLGFVQKSGRVRSSRAAYRVTIAFDWAPEGAREFQLTGTGEWRWRCDREADEGKRETVRPKRDAASETIKGVRKIDGVG